MLKEVGDTLFKSLKILGAEGVLRHSAVHLERLYRSDDNNGVRSYAGFAALDVKELLGSQVGSEARFRNNVIAELKRQLCSRNTVAAMGDVSEGASVNDGGVMLKRLNKVGLDGILEKGSHSSLGVELSCRNGFVVTGIADDYL